MSVEHSSMNAEHSVRVNTVFDEHSPKLCSREHGSMNTDGLCSREHSVRVNTMRALLNPESVFA